MRQSFHSTTDHGIYSFIIKNFSPQKIDLIVTVKYDLRRSVSYD